MSCCLLADIGIAQYAQPFSVRRHHSVLDPVVNHLHEMAGAARTAVQISLLGGAFKLFTTRRARNVARPRRQRREDRIECLTTFVRPQSSCSIRAQAPDTAARSDVHIVDSLCGKFFRAANIINVIGIPSIDENVSCFKMGHEYRRSVVSTTAAGTINHIARGFLSFLRQVRTARSPDSLSRTNSATAFDDRS